MSERMKPYGGSSSDRLTRLINESNGTSLVEGIDFEYGEPLAESVGRTNTKVALHVKHEDFRNQFLHYRRLDIGALALLPKSEKEAVYINSWPVSIHQELSKINASLGLNLTTEEVVNAVHHDRGQDKLPLKISNKSLAWLPSEYLFEIARETILLSTLWKTTILNGLFAPQKKIQII